MQPVRIRIHLRNRQVVSFEEDSRRGDVAVGEDFGRRLGIERLEVVDAQHGVTLGVRRVGVRRFDRLLLLQVFCSQLADLISTTDTKKGFIRPHVTQC